MRNSSMLLLLAAGLGLVSCTRQEADRRDEPAARQAGRDAYRATQEIKRDAKQAAEEIRKAGKEAAQDVRNAGKELREGWNDAKHQDPAKPKR